MNKTIKTRLSERSERVETNLTLNFENVTQEQLQELASRSAIIAFQAKCRADGEIPSEATFDVAEVFVKQPRTPKNPLDAAKAALAKMSDEERASFLAMLNG